MRGVLTISALLAMFVACDAGAQRSAPRDSILRAIAVALQNGGRDAPDLTVPWHLLAADASAATLASAVQVPHLERTAADAPPTCPWDRGGRKPGAQAVELRWLVETPDSARVLVSFLCTNPPGFLHRVNRLDHTYLIRREGDRWTARLENIGVTAVPRPPRADAVDAIEG